MVYAGVMIDRDADLEHLPPALAPPQILAAYLLLFYPALL